MSRVTTSHIDAEEKDEGRGGWLVYLYKLNYEQNIFDLKYIFFFIFKWLLKFLTVCLFKTESERCCMLSVYEEELVCWSIQIFWEFFCKLFSLNPQYSDEVILNLRILLSHGISELVTEVENFLVFSQAVIALIVKPCFGFVGWHWDQWRTGGHPHEAGGVGRSVLCGGTAWGGTWGRLPQGFRGHTEILPVQEHYVSWGPGYPFFFR